DVLEGEHVGAVALHQLGDGVGDLQQAHRERIRGTGAHDPALDERRPTPCRGGDHPEPADGGARIDAEHGEGRAHGQAPASSSSRASKSRLVKTFDTSSSSSRTSISLRTFWASAASSLTRFWAIIASSEDSIA